jgi:glucosyl-3-phosphoglycerate synthase
MDYVPSEVTTLHKLTEKNPECSMEDVVVVVPMLERDFRLDATEWTFSEIERIGPEKVIVALRCEEQSVRDIYEWLNGFNLDVKMLWCNGNRMTETLREKGLEGRNGKGHDIWLALGLASEYGEFIVCHDVDRKTYVGEDISRLLFPLTEGNKFVKGYYARIENDRLYGRLCRLFYAPLVRSLRGLYDTPILRYLDVFRYGLAGEFGIRSQEVKRIKMERGFGLEVGLLGEAFNFAGFESTAQVDLGIYEHFHREKSGPNGLAEMSLEVSGALFGILRREGVKVKYDVARKAYESMANEFIRQYGLDAKFNGLEYDAQEECAQVEEYRESIQAPRGDTRIASWEELGIQMKDIKRASLEDVDLSME